jgi:hypothetical protein
VDILQPHRVHDVQCRYALYPATEHIKKLGE